MLPAKIGQLVVEREFLRATLWGLERGQRLALERRGPGEPRVRRRCRLLGLSRPGLYYQPRPARATTLLLQRRVGELSQSVNLSVVAISNA